MPDGIMVCTFIVCYLYRYRRELVMRTGALEQDGGIYLESPRMKFSWPLAAEESRRVLEDSPNVM